MPNFFERMRSLFNETSHAIIPRPAHAVVPKADRMVILCRDVEEANWLQQQEAAKALRRRGVLWAQDGRWRLADGRQVEFLSIHGTLWWTRITQPNSHTVVVPLYRRHPDLDPWMRQMVDARLNLFASSVQIIDWHPEQR